MDPFENLAPSAAQEEADAKAALVSAEAEAAALLADLEAADPAIPPAKKYKLPSPYAPGEGPRDPVQSIQNTMTQRISAQEAAEKLFKPVDPDHMKQNTLPMTHTVDFAAKIKAARKDYGSH